MQMMSSEPLDFEVYRMPYFLRPDLPFTVSAREANALQDTHPDRAPVQPASSSSSCLATAGTPGSAPFADWGDYLDRYTRKHPEKFGREGQAPNARVGLSWQGAEVGLQFVFNQKMTNSMDSLRLLMKVQLEQTAAVRENFFENVSRKYFAEGRCLADHDMLIEAAEEAGVAVDGLREWLCSEEGTLEVQRQFAEIFYGWGFTAVPVTLVSWQGLDQCIQGSQNLQAYLDVFKKILDAPGPPVQEPGLKAPVWQKLSATAARIGTPYGHDFLKEAHSVFSQSTAHRAAVTCK